MKKLLGMFIVAITLVTIMYGCTDQQMARTFGGTENITLEPGVRLVNITWKGQEGNSSLWILTKKDTTKASTYSFKEKSVGGVLEGEVIINEQ